MKKIACIVLSFLFVFLFCAPALAAAEDAADTRPSVLMKTTAKVNVRSGPGTKHNILGKIDKDDFIYAMAVEGDWIKIIWNESEGYVYKKYTDYSYYFEPALGDTFEELLIHSETAIAQWDYIEALGKYEGKYTSGKYPSYYAGAYFEGPKCHILSTDISEKVQSELRAELGEGIVIDQVKYSLNDLAKKQKRVLASLKRFKDYISAYVNEAENGVDLFIPENASGALLAAVEKVMKKEDHIKICYPATPPRG